MKYYILFIVFFFCSSCVTTKVFNDLEVRYYEMKTQSNALKNSKDSIQKSWVKLNEKWNETKSYLKRSRDSINSGLNEIKILQDEYFLLKENSDQKIKENIEKNNSLIKEIAIKETELQSRLDRVNELEKMINEQKTSLNQLKESLSDALLNFEGKGLTVKQRNGKVYISMENKLLFKSGKWDIEREGKKALTQLSRVLEKNPDISILIEGHTDNVPFTSIGDVESNWDLSTKRATAVVKILLKNNQILPQNLTAAGRSEYLPIAPNSSKEGRASNRRIEVILSPSLEEITKLLEINN
jgi:chemotaxis protein MotB